MIPGSTGGSGAVGDLHDVNAPTPSTNDVLVFDAAAGRWQASPAVNLPASNETIAMIIALG